nr:Chain E, Amphiphysin [Homo sapiens]5M5S_F Chain F, Amphiphysin [Homo sapiens]5M5S_G Chain G, Amphiphysin [Homo sapiens]5M5S_H Chain H, Amphiphysin [Homo sapiens]
ETLLDLDFDP